MIVPDDVLAAAAKVRRLSFAEDELTSLGGSLLWATAESYYELLAAAKVLADWALTIKDNSGQSRV